MAGSAVTNLQVLVNTPGVEKLPKLASSLKRLTVSTKEAGLSFTQLSAGLKKQAVEGGKSINNTRSLSNAWKELAASVQFGSKEFAVATARAKQLNAQLVKMEGRKGGGMGRMARTAGAVAGAGVFGGPEGAIGAAIGGLMPGGGPISAAVGGAIGAQVGMVRQAIGSTAEYSAALARQRKALRLVIADTEKYNKSQKFLSQTSKDLAIPQDVIVRQFTALTASVTGAGHSVEEAEEVFRSIASGIRGTGGSLEDMKSAMRATAQVFSKGKVSAEELRQQLGERLPGAFTIFAESMGKTPAELDKALEQGKVTLQDFMTFSETLFKKYGDNAKILAAGPEAAGDRLATAMSELKDIVGKTITPIGAAFQESFSSIINQIGNSEEALLLLSGTLKTVGAAAFATFASVRFLTRSLVDLVRISGELAMGNFEKAMDIVKEGLKDTAEQAKEDWKLLGQIFNGVAEDINSVDNAIKNTKESTEGLGEKSIDVWKNMKAGADSYFKSISNVAEQIQKTMENAFTKMEDALVNFVMTGKMNFADFARSVIADLTRIFIRSQMLSMFKGLGNLFGGGSLAADRAFADLGPGSALNTTGDLPKGANGLVVGKNGIVPFAKGGIVSQPTIFPFKNGIGLMGEAGEEAVMPLRRGRDGRLGVEASGAGVGNIVVNVDASGSSVEGNSGQAEELGSILGAAIQAEIVNQQRPGGLLA
jgi:tape measure domain-containing protein